MPFYKKAAWLILVLSSVSLFFILLFQSSNVSTLPVGWDKTYPVVPYDIYVKNFRLTQKGNIIAVVYEGEKNKAAGIYVSLSFDNGMNFLQPVKIAPIDSRTEPNPDISVSANGHIAAVWQILTEQDPNSRIYYSTSADTGATWSAPTRVQSKTQMELMPKVLYDDKNRLHIFYNAYMEKGFSLFHIISEDEKKFDDPDSLVNISEGLRGAFFPAIESSNGYIYIVWQEKEKRLEALTDDLYFIRSANNGNSWTSKKLITKDKAKDSAPFINVYDNEIYLVYQNNETKNWAIKLMKGSDRGNVWSDPDTISTTNADCFSPVIVKSDDDNLFVIWYDTRNKIPGVYARKMPPQTKNPPAEVLLSRQGVPARKPLAVQMNRKIMALWEESGRLMAKTSDVHVDPPVVYSPSHPEDAWSKASTAILKWQAPFDESNIAGYATFLKKPGDYNLQDIDPTIINLAGNITEYRSQELEDGISYFYIRAVDGAGNYSRTVRYKIQVSKNPPSMPVVKSTTHPEGKPADATTAVLNWSMTDVTRHKGFLYNISKDAINAPDKFTTGLEVKFDHLNQGRYFFTLRSVDKTNALSPIATYEIIIGKAAKLDPLLVQKITQGTIEEKVKIKDALKPKIPAVELSLPFDISKAYDKAAFTAEINTVNITEKNIAGYSYFIGKEDKWFSDRINLKSNILTAVDLTDGEYFIGVKCRYFKYRNNVKEYFWTEPAVKKFSVSIAGEDPPAVAYLKEIIGRLSGSGMAVSVPLVGMLLSVMTIGLGAKASFYLKLLRQKFISLFSIF
ncbi:MAG: exo-alpha-sialidase [Spirochaetota bacterium]